MASSISEAQIMEEIRRWHETVPDREPNVLTGPEIAEIMGVCKKTAYVRIKRWIAEGKLEPCRTGITNMTGQRTSTWAYRVKT